MLIPLIKKILRGICLVYIHSMFEDNNKKKSCRDFRIFFFNKILLEGDL